MLTLVLARRPAQHAAATSPRWSRSSPASAFFAATGFVSDRVIDSLEGDVDRQYGNVDVAVVLDDDSDGRPPGDPGEELADLRAHAPTRSSALAGVDGGAGDR